jgi:thiamine-phosphate pyrophosphorylase
VAYGGIDSPERAKAAVEAGADGVAVTSTILDAPDPRMAAQALKDAVG